MERTFACRIFRNVLTVVVGLLIYLLTDTIASVLVGLLLDIFTKIHSDSLYFQIALRWIVAIINIRLITLSSNRIAIRNEKGHNIPECIIGTLIIIALAILCITQIKTQGLDIKSIIFYIFNVLLGLTLLLDSKEEMI